MKKTKTIKRVRCGRCSGRGSIERLKPGTTLKQRLDSNIPLESLVEIVTCTECNGERYVCKEVTVRHRRGKC